MESVLITGADGFIASHLINELRSNTNWKIFGIGLKPAPAAGTEGIEYSVVDITDYEAVRQALGACKPGGIFHLAAQPSVRLSWEDPWSTYTVNVLGQLNLMEALKSLCMNASVHIACSSEEYGKVPPEKMPLGEDAPFNPCSHYAVSKVAQETLGLMYHQAFGWRVLITRGFNQTGPGQSPEFVIPSFARQVALIEAGCCEPVLKVGNLEARRDFTDVRDTARAYRMAMEKGRPGGTYNVCSGKAYPVSEVLEMLLSLSDASIGVERDPERQRPSDIPLLLGDNKALRDETGWEPLIGLEQTLRDTLDYWRAGVGTGAGR